MKKKTILITGGAKGIGMDIAKLFSGMDGYNVLITYKTSEKEARLLENEYNVHSYFCDVKSEKDVSDLFDRIEKEFSGVDILVNNAGISKSGLFNELSESDWQDIIETNLGGVFRITKRALKNMLLNHSGVIINISSMWGEVGASCEVAYSASKAGIIGLTKALAKEVGPSGIRVNAITPGLVDTSMNDGYSQDDLNGIINETPLERIGSGLDIAKAVYFLSGDGADFITGQILGVNGGFVI